MYYCITFSLAESCWNGVANIDSWSWLREMSRSSVDLKSKMIPHYWVIPKRGVNILLFLHNHYTFFFCSELQWSSSVMLHRALICQNSDGGDGENPLRGDWQIRFCEIDVLNLSLIYTSFTYDPSWCLFGCSQPTKRTAWHDNRCKMEQRSERVFWFFFLCREMQTYSTFFEICLHISSADMGYSI